MATLKTLVDETTNIKNELVICHSKLKNNLIGKGVECSDTDKMSSLINKVNSLYVVVNNGVGDNYYIFRDKTKYITAPTEKLISTYTFEIDGDFRIYANFQEYNSSGGGRYKAVLKRNGEEVNTVEFLISSSSSGETSANILNVKVGDKLEFYARNYYNNKGYRGYLTQWGICCDMQILF